MSGKMGKRRKPLSSDEKSWLLLLILPVAYILVFKYLSMYGIVIAFQKFIPAKGFFGNQRWVGLDNFRYIFSLSNVWRAIVNTLSISVWKVLLGLLVPVCVALMLNEVNQQLFKRSVQTIIYLPNFISWVILSGIFVDLLSTTGIVNRFLGLFGVEPIFFLGSNRYFRATLIVTDIWKGFGYSSIIYLSAITAIDPQLYESARIDGAGRFRCIRHITIPGIAGTIALMGVLSIGSLLNAGFDQILNLYSPQVYETGDIIDTFVYRFGLLEAKYGPSQAVSVAKSVISSTLTVITYWLAYRYAGYSLF
ncbi:MAG: ABC transporter permease [Christensenellales bacterium]